jgi:hypothetical protein
MTHEAWSLQLVAASVSGAGAHLVLTKANGQPLCPKVMDLTRDWATQLDQVMTIRAETTWK